MQNGYQIDPLEILLDHMREQGRTLHGLNRAAGRIEQRLEDGANFHQEVKDKLEDHGHRLFKLEQGKDDESSSSIILQWLEVFQRLWPLLFLITTLAGAIGVHVPDWAKELSKHSISE